MVFGNREGLSESTIEQNSIHAKPTTNEDAHTTHTKVTGTSIPSLIKYCLDVCLAGIDSSNPLPVEDAGDLNEFFLETTVVSDSPGGGVSGTVQTAITYTVLAGETLRLNNVLASSGENIICKIRKNGTLIGTTRSGSANKQATFRWEPNRTFTTGDVMLITVQDITGNGAGGADMDVFFQGRKY